MAHGEQMTRRRKVLVISGDIYSFGGSEMHCIRCMDLLQRDFDIELVHTGGPLDSERIAAWSGRSLDPRHVSFTTIRFSRFMSKLGGNWTLLKYAIALRHAARISSSYDLVFTAFGECTVDHPRVLQYVQYHQFFFDRESLGHLGVQYRTSVQYFLRELYVRSARWIANWKRPTVLRAKTLTNSGWTAEQFRRVYQHANVEPLYPGIEVLLSPGDPDFVPFSERENSFVIIGRIVPSKRIDAAIEIVRRLREELGHDVGLKIIGRASKRYLPSIQALLRDKPWVSWYPDLNRTELEALVARQKWGLHCYRFEHYGLAPGELQKLGCIVFVHDSGGQREIVTRPEARYSDTDDAVKKIAQVLENGSLQEALLRAAAASTMRHRVEDFDKAYLAAVHQLVGQNAPQPDRNSMASAL